MPGFNRIWRVEHVTQRPGTHPCSNATVCRCRCCLLKAGVVSLALSARAQQCRELQPYRKFNLTGTCSRLMLFILPIALVFQWRSLIFGRSYRYKILSAIGIISLLSSDGPSQCAFWRSGSM